MALGNIDRLLADNPELHQQIMQLAQEPWLSGVMDTLERSNKPPPVFDWHAKKIAMYKAEKEEGGMENEIADAELTFLRDAMEVSDSEIKKLERDLKTALAVVDQLQDEIERLKAEPKVIYEPSF